MVAKGGAGGMLPLDWMVELAMLSWSPNPAPVLSGASLTLLACA